MGSETDSGGVKLNSFLAMGYIGQKPPEIDCLYSQ